MMTMYWLRGVCLAGLFMVPVISGINSTSERTVTGKEVQTSVVQTVSTGSEPTAADKGTSTTVSTILAIISTTQSPSPTATGNDSTQQEATLPTDTSSNSPQPTTSGPVSTVAPTIIAGYVMLVITVITIAVLCWILIYLRRRSKWYSFDFKYPVRLMDPPGTFETVNMDGPNTVDLSPLPASNGECLSGPGEGLVSQVILPSSGGLPLDTEQTDRKWDQSDGVSLHITEEEQENSTTLACGSTAP